MLDSLAFASNSFERRMVRHDDPSTHCQEICTSLNRNHSAAESPERGFSPGYTELSTVTSLGCRALCTGDKGKGLSGIPLSYKGDLASEEIAG